MSDSQPKEFFLSTNEGFVEARPEDELLHAERNQAVTADSLTETQYFGFSVPEERIHSICYLWHHPNLKVVTGGLFVFRGVKGTIPAAELCDVRAFMSDRSLKNDLHDYRLENGYGVKIVEPLKRFHLTYEDQARGNAVDLWFEGLRPPIMFADGNHMEQPLRVKGRLLLRGKEYVVNCYNVRDRSWGQPRSEEARRLPPQSWMSGVFNDQFAFQCNMFDHTGGNPELAGGMEWPDEKGLINGWIWKDGKLGRIVQGFKSTTRDRPNPKPLHSTLDLKDDLGRQFTIKGELVASCAWQPWHNINNQITLMRWQCEGLTAYGDCQDAYWSDYLNHIASK